jgi:hypothetical protein
VLEFHQVQFLEQVMMMNRDVNISPLKKYYEFINSKGYYESHAKPLQPKKYRAFIINESILHRQILTTVGEYELFNFVPRLFGNKPVPLSVLFLYEVLLHYEVHRLNISNFTTCYINFVTSVSLVCNMLYTWNNFPLSEYIELLNCVIPEAKKTNLTNTLTSNFNIYRKSKLEFKEMLDNGSSQYCDIVFDNLI